MKSCWVIVLVLVLCCVGCTGAPSPQGPSPDVPAALELLKARQPEAKWKAKSLLRGDFDLDGGEDYAMLGVEKDQVVVGIVHGPVKAGKNGVWILDFPWDGGEDALCSKKAQIAIEPLAENPGPKAEHPSKGLGINLSDDLCDAFHIYWNPREQTFEWWRL